MTDPNVRTIKLDQPIARGDTKISQVEIRKPKPGSLRGMSLRDVVSADTSSMITLLPRITTPTLTSKEVEDMDVADFVECSNQVVGFLQQREASTASQPE